MNISKKLAILVLGSSIISLSQASQQYEEDKPNETSSNISIPLNAPQENNQGAFTIDEDGNTQFFGGVKINYNNSPTDLSFIISSIEKSFKNLENTVNNIDKKLNSLVSRVDSLENTVLPLNKKVEELKRTVEDSSKKLEKFSVTGRGLELNQDLYIKEGFNVAGRSNFSQDVKVNSTIIYSNGKVHVGDELEVSKNARIQQNLVVHQATTLNGHAAVDSLGVRGETKLIGYARANTLNVDDVLKAKTMRIMNGASFGTKGDYQDPTGIIDENGRYHFFFSTQDKSNHGWWKVYINNVESDPDNNRHAILGYEGSSTK